MRWNRLVPPLVASAAALGGCSSAAPPPDPSRIPASFALAKEDFPDGYEFHDDRDLRGLDMLELGPKGKEAQGKERQGADPRLADYSKLTLDHLSIDQQACEGLSELGRRPAYHVAAGPLAPTSADARSSLGLDRRSSTTLTFVVTRIPLPLDQYRQALAGCGQLTAASEKIGQGQAAMSPVDAPDGGFAYALEAKLQSPSGIAYAFSRVLVAAPVGQSTVLGSISRTASAEGGEKPLDQATLRAMFQKLVAKVKAG
ncbi:MAG: hypothetical protein ACRC20_14900 [Segniliparus sp.]|uniref:hypothetical protein n=1 Tax=Segniliparus sp. TaxID=2804064 RepID=UPI003F357D62